MKYTESCHLPQWEKSDRVMMEDFNRMCGDIDRELEGAKRTRQKLEQLARDSYRQEVRSRVHHGKGGETDAMWVNALETRESAGGDGHGWNGRYGVSFGPGSLPTLAGIRATAKGISFINDTFQSDPMSNKAEVEFVSDGYGTLENVMVWSLMHSTIYGKEFTYYISLFRMDTNSLAGQAGPFTSDSYRGTNKNTFVTVNFPLEAGVRYRMSFEKPEDQHLGGEAGIMLGGSLEQLGFETLTFTDRPIIPSISYQAVIPENRGAIALVRWAGSGSFTFMVRGTTAAEVRTRDTINAEGKTCKETELAVEQLPAGTAEIKIEFQSTDEDFSVFDYGLIWQ